MLCDPYDVGSNFPISYVPYYTKFILPTKYHKYSGIKSLMVLYRYYQCVYNLIHAFVYYGIT